jgi:hypothetical protein
MFGSGVMGNQTEIRNSFEWKMIKLGKGRNGQYSLTSIISAEKWCKLNGIEIEQEREKYARN